MMLLAHLGGVGGVERATVPRLPDPPLLAHYVLESPWLPAAVLVGAGVVAFYVLNRGGKAGQGVRWLGGLTLLAGILIGVAALVTTEREALRERTLELVDITAAADTVRLGPMLSDGARASPFNTLYGGAVGRERVLADVRSNLGEAHPIAEHTIGETQAVLDGPNVARTQVRVRVKLQNYDDWIGSWVRVGWRRDGEGPWKVTSVTVLQIDLVGLNRAAE